jgi:hypothetical protein
MTIGAPRELLMFQVSLLLTLTGIVLFAVGFRGRRIDDHPLCRRCGYDLWQQPAQRPVCPECGTNTTEKPPRIGHRRLRSRRPIIGGIGLAALGALLLSVETAVRSERPDLYPYKPLWLLRIEARRAPDARSWHPAMVEIVRRIDAGQISIAQCQSLVRDALAVQTLGTGNWSQDWTNIMIAAADLGAITQQQYATFAERAVILNFEVRQKVRQGAVLPYRLTCRDGRGLTRDDAFIITIDDAALRIGDWVHETSLSEHVVRGSLVERERTRTVSGSIPSMALPLGPHLIDLVFSASLRRFSMEEPPVFTWSGTRTASIEVVPGDQPTVVLVQNNTILEEMRRSAATGLAWCNSERTPHIRAYIALPPRFMQIAYDVEVLGTTARAAIVSARSDGGADAWLVEHSLPGLTAARHLATRKTIDFVLRPNVAAAEETVDITAILAGEIVIRDVPVERLH